MKLFAKAQCADSTGWRQITLTGFQVNRKFLDEKGFYCYGTFALVGQSVPQLETELLETVPNSTVRFAVIDTTSDGWSPQNTSAFRLDLDFYVFMGVTPAKAQTLEAYVATSGASVLCMTTPLSV
ncbi:MAG: hypothetical protein AB7H97_11890 [Pseudobdellovibrionaceae bacterium]